MGVISDLEYALRDACTTSEAEANVEKYEKGKKELEPLLDDIRKKISMACEAIEVLDTLLKTDDMSRGKMITDYEIVVGNTRNKLIGLINYYSYKEEELKAMFTEIKGECKYWNKIKKREDQLKKEYKDGKYCE